MAYKVQKLVGIAVALIFLLLIAVDILLNFGNTLFGQAVGVVAVAVFLFLAWRAWMLVREEPEKAEEED